MANIEINVINSLGISGEDLARIMTKLNHHIAGIQQSHTDSMSMRERDLRICIDDGHLTPNQKRHWDAKEKEFSERQAKQADHSRALSEAAGAMDKVDQGFGHKLGWRHE